MPAQYSTQSSGAVAVVVVLYGAGRSCRPGRTLAKKMNKLTYVPNLDGTIVWVYHKTPRHPEAHVVSGALIIREPYLVLGHFRAGRLRAKNTITSVLKSTFVDCL